LTASKYYTAFVRRFSTGPKTQRLSRKGFQILSELVALLPDASLRQRLRDEHASHVLAHRIANDFPTLRGDTSSAAPSYGPFVASAWEAPSSRSASLAPDAFPSLATPANNSNNSNNNSSKKKKVRALRTLLYHPCSPHTISKQSKAKKQVAGSRWAQAAASAPVLCSFTVCVD
jgi:hypothetical protein